MLQLVNHILIQKIQLCDIYNLSHKIGYTNTNATLSGKVLGAEKSTWYYYNGPNYNYTRRTT